MRQSCSWRTVVRTATVIGLSILTACASPPTRFYTLSTEAGPTIAGNTASPSFRIDVRPVKVPAAVARSQLVVQVNAAQVQVLEDDRWASSLPDEIRYALVAGVSQKAGAPGAKTVARGDVPVYQVAVDVQRFESWPGSHALIDVVWDVRTLTDDETLTCHSVVSEPVSDGYQAVVGGHRRAISVVAAQIAKVIRAFAASATDSPFRPTGASGKARNRMLSCPHMTDAVETAADRAVARIEE
ncbi:membrane integrity-associated transporter subunit PqiC [Paraburkholderia sp. LEh10]|uniref:PqiC family protein n=1 Tax=Paraburkholderia sp. LEh10 TaxID=2821353 RepID=UPI001AE2E7F2|nr:PqiC family protein [Paraburkholderia sp. LEh10]MBP0588304.1 membrane integrity-associated transporter subunit PqiC [Paraburkholderia sp. LEh10]